MRTFTRNIAVDVLTFAIGGYTADGNINALGRFLDALEGDDPELACGYLDEMVYRCSDAEDTGYLFDMMAKSKHGDHYYAEYC
jgi:hypothetical protein